MACLGEQRRFDADDRLRTQPGEHGRLSSGDPTLCTEATDRVAEERNPNISRRTAVNEVTMVSSLNLD